MFITANIGVVGSFYPLKAKEKFKHQANTVAVGSLVTAGTLAFFATGLLVGRDMLLVGPKLVVTLAVVLCSGAGILFGFVDTMRSWVTFLGFGIALATCQGVSNGAMFTGVFTLLAGLFPDATASVTAAIEIFNGIGYVIGPLVGGVLYDRIGFYASFYLFGGLLAVMVPVLFKIVPAAEATRVRDSNVAALSPIEILSFPAALLLTIIICAGGAGLLYSLPMLSIHLEHVYHLEPSTIGLCIVVEQVVKCVVSLFVGRLADGYPRRPIMLIGLVCMSLGFFLMGSRVVLSRPKLVLFLLGYGLIGAGTAMSIVPGSAEVISVMNKHGYPSSVRLHGSVGGVVGSAKALGQSVGPLLGSLLYNKYNFSTSVMSVSGAMAVLAVCLFLQTCYSALSPQLETRQSAENGRDSDQTADFHAESQPLLESC